MPALLAPANLAHQALPEAGDLQPSPATLSWRRRLQAYGHSRYWRRAAGFA